MPEPIDYQRQYEKCEAAMRTLACSLGAGGFNSTTFDPDVFFDKIQWGINDFATSFARMILDKKKVDYSEEEIRLNK